MSFFQKFFGRGREYNDLSAELQAHLDEKMAELMAEGMSREEASAAARRQFGNTTLIEEEGRATWAMSFDTLLRDLRYAARQLRRNPGFSITVVLTLTLAIGLNTTAFSVINSLFLRPLPYPQPEKLGALVRHDEGLGKNGKNFSEDDNSHDGETWELVKQNITAAHAAVYGGSSGVNLEADGQVRYVQQQRVSAGYFSVLGVQPMLGREFTEEEDRPQGPKVVILSHDLWKQLFHSDRDAPGKTIHLKGEAYTVVGVLPSAFQGPSAADLWVPLQPSTSGEGGGTNYGIILRLKNGENWAALNSQLILLHPSLFDYFTKNYKAKVWLAAIPLQSDMARGDSTPAVLLMSAVSLILLIACANLAGLLLVRTGRRAPEISTRLALGASYSSIFRLIALEPLLLAVVSCAAGIGLALNVLRAARELVPEDMIPANGLHLDWRVLGFSMLVAFLAAMLVGLLPAFELRRTNLRNSETSGSGRVAQSGSQRARKTLMAAEVALTVVMLAGAGLLIRTLVRLRDVPAGFEAANVMTARLSLDDARYHDVAAFQRLLNQSLDAMRRIPGVESAAVGLSLPFERGLNDGLVVSDGPYKDWQTGSSTAYITPDYFKVLRIPLIQGRTLQESDTAGTQPVTVVNTAFAHRFFKDDAVGHHIRFSKNDCLIVGVVGNVAKPPGMSVDAPISTEPMFYVPASQVTGKYLTLVHVWFQPSWIVRTSGPISGLNAQMQAALAESDPSLPFAGFHTLADLENRALSLQQFEVTLLTALGGLALLLSLLGIYGLVSNIVVQRTREIGIRMALGSTVPQAMLEMGRSAAAALGIGIVAGLALSAFGLRFLQSELYGVRSYDPPTIISVVLLLGLAALLASFAPTLRIARINPAVTLRAE